MGGIVTRVGQWWGIYNMDDSNQSRSVVENMWVTWSPE